MGLKTAATRNGGVAKKREATKFGGAETCNISQYRMMACGEASVTCQEMTTLHVHCKLEELH